MEIKLGAKRGETLEVDAPDARLVLRQALKLLGVKQGDRDQLGADRPVFPKKTQAEHYIEDQLDDDERVTPVWDINYESLLESGIQGFTHTNSNGQLE